ncbi:MAG: hypothetical protein ISS56_11970 [Anaerolineae bacterium]|nr:hypothetical protein [Anaerolineae bacterium]
MGDTNSGHRQRLRQQFLTSRPEFSQLELLELLLTYAIPRRDVAPLAHQLLEQFGSLSEVLDASHGELTAIPGIGEHAAVLIKAVAQMQDPADLQREPISSSGDQPALFDIETDSQRAPAGTQEPDGPQMRTFTNDLSAAALEYLPRIIDFSAIEDYQVFLEENLPYNSLNSRKRYARNLINRYYPSNEVQIPLTVFFSYQPCPDALKAVLFYETARAEPAVQLVAEEAIWPAVPVGRVTRDQLRERVQHTFSQASTATVKRMVYSLLNVYTVLNGAQSDDDTLRFQIHPGTLEAFLYVLAAEFPEPGMYRFEELEQGPMRLWLLWDREWMHRQLYNLRDLGVLTKVSQIDTLRQFTLQYDRRTALRHYFEHPERESLALREHPLAGSEG